MAYNFLRGDRDQPFLLPPDLRDWLPDGHLAWFILDVVDQLDLEPFLRSYRADGHGHPAYDPKTLLGVLLYGYAIGVRSSRQIQRRCTEDLAFRALAGNQAPDHVTIARFRVRHQAALGGRAGRPPPAPQGHQGPLDRFEDPRMGRRATRGEG
jgi:transposase